VRPDDVLTRSVVAILGAVMMLKVSDIAVYWFESEVQAKYTVWVQNGVFVVFAMIRLLLILQEAPLIAFAWAMLGEAAVVAMILLTILGRKGIALSQLSASIARAKTLLADSWSLIISAIAITLYMRIDQIMLGQMIGDEAVGVYSAAVRISEVWYFIPMAIVASVFPALLEAKKRSEAEYNARFQRLYDVMVIISMAFALPMTFLAAPIVGLLYGASYRESGPVLALHIWASIFVFLGVASGKWFIAENRQILLMQRTLLGALVNVCLNLWLIPSYGVTVAAAATVFSYAVAAFFADLFARETRQIFVMKARSLSFVSIFNGRGRL
jgi:PST family polysaccharide transporter